MKIKLGKNLALTFEYSYNSNPRNTMLSNMAGVNFYLWNELRSMLLNNLYRNLGAVLKTRIKEIL